MSTSRNGWIKAIQLLTRRFKPENEKSVTLIGQDNRGNQYFEADAPNHYRKTQRFYKTIHLDKSTHVVDVARVPPAWDAWLRFKRKDPPSEEELRESDEYFEMQQALAAKKASEEETKRQKDKPAQSEDVRLLEESKMPKKRAFPKLPFQRPEL